MGGSGTTDPDSVAGRCSVFCKKIRTVPYKKLKFITIRDNQGKTELKHVVDWLRKYSNFYMLVRGMKGGPHFHALIVHNGNQSIRCKKKLHTKIQAVRPSGYSVKKPEVFRSRSEIVEDDEIMIWEDHCNEMYWRLVARYEIPITYVENHMSVIRELKRKDLYINLFAHYQSIANASIHRSKQRKEDTLHNIILYLIKNYEENSLTDRLVEFQTLYFRIEKLSY